MANVRVRRAVEADAEMTATVNLRSWQAAYRGVVPDEALDSLDLEEWVERHRGQLASPVPPGVHRLVSVDDGDAVRAIANAGPAREPVGDTTGELYLMYADPDVWGEGHGHALLEEVHRLLAGEGHRHALLWVATGNTRTIEWYEAHGWSLDGATDTVEIEGVAFDESRMVRAL
jgi:GNAT superfamily N-acetyltransferase